MHYEAQTLTPDTTWTHVDTDNNNNLRKLHNSM